MQSPVPSKLTPAGIGTIRVDETARLERCECCRKHRLLALPLAIAKPRQQCFAVEHHGGVGGKDEIGQPKLRLDGFDRGASGDKRAVEAGPLRTRQLI